jgi:hypothetical protein
LAQEFEKSYPGSTNLLPIAETRRTGNRGRRGDADEEGKEGEEGNRVDVNMCEDGGEDGGEDEDISGVMVLNMEKEFSSREVPVMLRYLLKQNSILTDKVKALSSYIEKIGRGDR